MKTRQEQSVMEIHRDLKNIVRMGKTEAIIKTNGE